MRRRSRGTRLAVVLAVGALLVACGDNDGGEEGDAGSEADQATDTAQFDEARALFTQDAQPACATCHTLADAGTTGTIGPNLDALGPTAEVVERALRSGPGQMPDFSDTLSDGDIEALATYVEAVAGNG